MGDKKSPDVDAKIPMSKVKPFNPVIGRFIFVTFQFDGIHSWPECPIKEVSFLKNPHRHIFHGTLVKQVTHNDRDIEFIQLKREVLRFIHEHWFNDGNSLGSMSCEEMAGRLLDQFKAVMVIISEDGENGAVITHNTALFSFLLQQSFNRYIHREVS
jgi:hypothetical protein